MTSTASASRSRPLLVGTSVTPLRTPSLSSVSSEASTCATLPPPTTSPTLLNCHPSPGRARCSPSKSCVSPTMKRPRLPVPWWPQAPPAPLQGAAPSHLVSSLALPPRALGAARNRAGGVAQATVLAGRTGATAPWDHGSATALRPPMAALHLQATAGSRAPALAAGNPMAVRVPWVHARRPTLSSLHLRHLHPLQQGIRPASSPP